MGGVQLPVPALTSHPPPWVHAGKPGLLPLRMTPMVAEAVEGEEEKAEAGAHNWRQ